MNKKHQDTTTVHNTVNSPTIEDLERILKRIEELDIKLENGTDKTTNSKQAA